MYRIIVIALLLTCLGIACSSPSVKNDHAGNHSAPNVQRNAASHSDHSNMDHGSMDHSTMQSSPGAASAPYELQFLDSMIAHHRGAVEMAQLAETRAQRAEVKELASNIINDQEREIAKMSEWRERWFEGKGKAINMDFPGMSAGMRGMDVKKLGALKGGEFDVEFVRQMIPHHEGALEMAKAIRSGDSYAELKELASDITAAQEAEIKQMKTWLQAWQ